MLQTRRSVIMSTAATCVVTLLLPLTPAKPQTMLLHGTGARVPDNLLQRIKRQNSAAYDIDAKINQSEELSGLLKSIPELASPAAARANKFDWRSKNCVTPVRNQGICGSCWIFGALAAYESAYLKANPGVNAESLEISEQEILDCAFSETNCVVGGWHEVVAVYLLTLGAIEAARYPYNSNNPQRGVYCNSNFKIRPFYARNFGYVSADSVIPPVATLKKALLDYGPLVSGITVDDGWQDVPSGIPPALPSNGDSTKVNHEILIVGWDDTLKVPGFNAGAWVIKNSWSKDWGSNGFAYVPYAANNVGFAASWITAWPVSVQASEAFRLLNVEMLQSFLTIK